MKIFLLLIILNYSIFASEDVNINKNLTKISEKQEIKSNEKDDNLKELILEEVKNQIDKNNKNNLTLVYNIDQIYKSANDFYDNAFKQFIEEIKWILAIFLGAIGLLKIKDIFDKNKITERMNNIEEQIKEEYKKEIEKINNNVLRSEFNREKMEIMYENTKDEKEKKIEIIQEKIQCDYSFFDDKIKKEAYIFIGKEFQKMKEEYKAIEAYEKALTYEKNNELDVIIHNNLGVLKDGRKLSQEALEHYKKSLEIKDSENSYANLIALYLELKSFETAGEVLEKAIMRFPNSSLLRSKKALLYADTGEYYKAIENYTIAINLDNNNKTAWFNRSVAYYEIGENFKALNDLLQIIKMNQECDRVFNMIARIYFLERKTDKALEYYDKALEVNKINKEAFYGKIDTYLILGEKDKARKLLDEFILKNENEDKVYYIYSQITEERNIKEALKYIKKAINLSPSNYKYYSQKGYIEIAMNRREEALKSFKASLMINPTNDIMYHDMGMLNFELEKYEEALANYRKAIELNKNESEYYNSRGVCLEKIGDNEDDEVAKKGFYIEALQDYEKANDLFEKIMFIKNINIIKNKLKKL